MILPFSLRRLGLNLAVCRREHILDEYSVTRCGVVDHNVRDGADELAVLDDGAARHECVQVGTTVFNKKFIFPRI